MSLNAFEDGSRELHLVLVQLGRPNGCADSLPAMVLGKLLIRSVVDIIEGGDTCEAVVRQDGFIDMPVEAMAHHRDRTSMAGFQLSPVGAGAGAAGHHRERHQRGMQQLRIFRELLHRAHGGLKGTEVGSLLFSPSLVQITTAASARDGSTRVELHLDLVGKVAHAIHNRLDRADRCDRMLSRGRLCTVPRAEVLPQLACCDDQVLVVQVSAHADRDGAHELGGEHGAGPLHIYEAFAVARQQSRVGRAAKLVHQLAHRPT
mmetsp:Transcript_32982/g.74563  ORF Transcript_32982/g.74563 Transcript_32982/m.74563 type:complete len:261 (+) Transcript_32982:401-1183(+)